MIIVVIFYFQRGMYAVINKALGCPGDFPSFLFLFVRMLAVFQCEYRSPWDRSSLNTGFLCFSLAWSRYAAGTQGTSCCSIIIMEPFLFRLSKLNFKQQRPPNCLSTYTISSPYYKNLRQATSANPLKTKINLNCTRRPSPYRAVNKLLFVYETSQPVLYLSLFWDPF